MIGFKIKTGRKDIQKDERERFGRASCPYCGQRHFWKRRDKWKLRRDNETQVDCSKCGDRYWIMMNADGIGVHIRANRREE